MMEDLPEGWTAVPLRSVTLCVRNIDPSDTPNRLFRYVDISAIDNERFQIVPAAIKRFAGSEAPSRARRPIQPGDVLVSNVRTYLRNTARVQSKQADICSTGFTVLRPSGAVEPDYLFRWVLTDAFVDAVTPQQTGTHYPATSDRVVLDEIIPLPPIAEQRRIVEKIEELLGHVNAARDRLAKVPAILRRFRQSVLSAACSGQLTEDWRGRNGAAENRPPGARQNVHVEDTLSDEIPPCWDWAEAESLCVTTRPITYGVIKLGPPVSRGVPTLRSSDVRWLNIKSETVKSISRSIADQYQRTYLRGNEVLVTVRGTLGGVAVVPPTMRGYNISREVAQLPLTHDVNPTFIAYAIASESAQDWLRERAKGVAYTGVNIEDLRRLPLPRPPLSEQEEIVRRVNGLFALADTVERAALQATKQVEALPHAILDKAFSGELVPTESELARAEGREYESAEELLQRIRSSKGHSSAASTKRRGRRSAHDTNQLAVLQD